MRRHIKVQLPFPKSEFSGNGRKSHIFKAHDLKKARITGRLCTLEALGGRKAAPIFDDKDYQNRAITIQVVVNPKNRQCVRDEDNMLASLKPYLDGLADALGVDDRNFHFKEQVWHAVTGKTSNVELHVWWMEA